MCWQTDFFHTEAEYQEQAALKAEQEATEAAEKARLAALEAAKQEDGATEDERQGEFYL